MTPTSSGSGSLLCVLPGKADISSGPPSRWENSGVGAAVRVALTLEPQGWGYTPGLWKGCHGCDQLGIRGICRYVVCVSVSVCLGVRMRLDFAIGDEVLWGVEAWPWTSTRGGVPKDFSGHQAMAPSPSTV